MAQGVVQNTHTYTYICTVAGHCQQYSRRDCLMNRQCLHAYVKSERTVACSDYHMVTLSHSLQFVGLYSNVVTYFLRYRCVPLITITPSLHRQTMPYYRLDWQQCTFQRRLSANIYNNYLKSAVLVSNGLRRADRIIYKYCCMLETWNKSITFAKKLFNPKQQ